MRFQFKKRVSSDEIPDDKVGEARFFNRGKNNNRNIKGVLFVVT